LLAIEKKEKAAVYGDYDVDGVTSTCLIYEYLTEKGLSCIIHIPDRIDEGYGINENAIRDIADKGASLIITVDCGITAFKEMELAKELGVDVIITDHHECMDELPQAIAVIDPKRHESAYPFPYLAGVGVAFKLLCAIEGKEKYKDLLNTYGDLVALGTLADVMPVLGENRFLIRYGMDIVRSGKRKGLASLVEAAGENIKKIAADKIGYTISPRLNAAGRMGQARIAFSLLSANGKADSCETAKVLCDLNRERQSIEAIILAEANAMINEQPVVKPIVLGSDSWHQGVAGIVASRLSERYYVPTIIVCFDGEEGHGSCRSAGNFNLYSALEASKEHLVCFGGHTLAAGLTVRRENFEQFKNSFSEYYSDNVGSGSAPSIDINFSVEDASLFTLKNVEDLMALEPWGNCNPHPVLCIWAATIEQITPIGDERHLKLRISKNGASLDCIFFAKKLFDLAMKPGDIADFAFYPHVNEFRGGKNIQLILRDARPSQLSSAARDAELELVSRFGEYLSKEDKRQFLPDRRNFVDVWHALEKLSENEKQISGELQLVLYGMGAHIATSTVPKIYACLRIFSELGLISISENENYIEITVHSNRRTDLNSSKILRRLRS
jgi:single-stranded-DNA-specific exonuclease